MAKKQETKRTIKVGIFQAGTSTEAVTLTDALGKSITEGDAIRHLNNVIGYDSWKRIATIDLTLEPVTTMKVTAKVMP